jgi:hypothetical protein
VIAAASAAWTDRGCTAYYLDEHGRNFAIYPGFASEYRRRTRPFDPDPSELLSRGGVDFFLPRQGVDQGG